MSALDAVEAARRAALPLAAQMSLTFGPESPGAGEDHDDSDDDQGLDEPHRYLMGASPWYASVSRGESPGEPGHKVALTPHTAEASTVHEPTRPPGGPGLFHIKGKQLPPYVQHLWHHLRKQYGDHRAYGMAIGIVKKWAAGVHPGGKAGKKGGHRVHADVQAAAAKNVAEWERDKAEAHAHSKGKQDHKVAASRLRLARGYERVEHGRLERVSGYGSLPRPGEAGVRQHLATSHGAGQHFGTLSDAELAERHDQMHELVPGLSHTHPPAPPARAVGRTPEQEARAFQIAANTPSLYQWEEAARRNQRGAWTVAASAPAAWPSGKPYKESLLPPGPTTSVPRGRSGVTNAPGTKPMGLRQEPAAAVSASPPLPPGVSLPKPAELEKLVGKVQDGADLALANSVRKHLHAAAGKVAAGDNQGALAALRSAQAGVHAAYRAAYNENLPHTAQVYGVRFNAVPPAEQSSATTEMLAGREVTEHYRALSKEIAHHIDTFRRAHFHGAFQHMPEARFSQGGEVADGVKMLALAFWNRGKAAPEGGSERVRAYERVEHGKLEQVGPSARERKAMEWWRARAPGAAHSTHVIDWPSRFNGEGQESKGAGVYDRKAGMLGTVEKQGRHLWHATHSDGTELGGKATKGIAVKTVIDYHNQMASKPHADPERIRELETEQLGIGHGHGELYKHGSERFSDAPLDKAKDYLADAAARFRKAGFSAPQTEETLRNLLGKGWSDAEREEIVQHGLGTPAERQARQMTMFSGNEAALAGSLVGLLDRFALRYPVEKPAAEPAPRPARKLPEPGQAPADTGKLPDRLSRRTGTGRVRPYFREERGREEEVHGYDRLAEALEGTARGMPGSKAVAYLHAAATALRAGNHEGAVNHLVSAHTVSGGDRDVFRHLSAVRAAGGHSPLARVVAAAGPNPHGAAGAIYK